MELDDLDGPTADDLELIEWEWPVIEAEIELLDAQIRILCAENGPTELDWRRLRRAQRRRLRALVELAYAADDTRWAHVRVEAVA